MVAYGFPGRDVGTDLAVAQRLGATILEILPDWKRFPDPREMARRALDGGFAIHSAHGCWGGTTITAPRVDLGATEPVAWQASVDDLKRCLDWLAEASGRCLVVHPGGLSDPKDFPHRREALSRGLEILAAHAATNGAVVCVENMPHGVHPGSRMDDLAALVGELDRPTLGLALDTGHAHIVSSPVVETEKAGARLLTTHVHDNRGQDTHNPPGQGTIDWEAWAKSLDEIDYNGPIVLECIRILRQAPGLIDQAFLERMNRLTRRD